MKCVICKTGEMAEGKATDNLQRGETTVVNKDTPTRVGDNRGEYYLSEDMTEQVLDMAESVVRKGVEMEIMRWAG